MDQLLEILAGVKPDVDFIKETALVDDGIIDSFDIVSIVNEVNDAFNVEIAVADLDPDNFNSAASILALIRSLQG